MNKSKLFLLKWDAHGWRPDNKLIHDIVDEYWTDGKQLFIQSTVTLKCGQESTSLTATHLPRVQVDFVKADGCLHSIEVASDTIMRIKRMAEGGLDWSLSERDQDRLAYGV